MENPQPPPSTSIPDISKGSSKSPKSWFHIKDFGGSVKYDGIEAKGPPAILIGGAVAFSIVWNTVKGNNTLQKLKAIAPAKSFYCSFEGFKINIADIERMVYNFGRTSALNLEFQCNVEMLSREPSAYILISELQGKDVRSAIELLGEDKLLEVLKNEEKYVIAQLDLLKLKLPGFLPIVEGYLFCLSLNSSFGEVLGKWLVSNASSSTLMEVLTAYSKSLIKSPNMSTTPLVHTHSSYKTGKTTKWDLLKNFSADVQIKYLCAMVSSGANLQLNLLKEILSATEKKNDEQGGMHVESSEKASMGENKATTELLTGDPE